MIWLGSLESAGPPHKAWNWCLSSSSSDRLWVGAGGSGARFKSIEEQFQLICTFGGLKILLTSTAVWTGNVKLRLFWGNFSAPSMFQMFHQLLERHSFPLRLKLLHPSVCLQSSGGRSWGSSSRTSPHSSLQKVWQYELKYNTSCGYCVCCLIARNFSFLFVLFPSVDQSRMIWSHNLIFVLCYFILLFFYKTCHVCYYDSLSDIPVLHPIIRIVHDCVLL